ncbi:STY4851/ECs_5259 family protein [Pectobacterium polaris]|uniref:STY4851/ECs_5259 family protein n=1 Tax=Pectobacterium polaris TaxID=2042057 RepID=UPI001CC3FCAB|nr:STY4851/ECs_5259 family protein [Pectobacterium polaris]UAY91687.1 STY4851/ECs_5259 family protein [Pectobacterium polaris]
MKTSVNPLLYWLKTFFLNRSLIASDGRALYAYRCNEREYNELGQILRKHAPRTYPKTVFISYSDALFCLYAAEFIRRNHTAGHPKWDAILQSINWQIPYPHRQKLVSEGIRHWKREVRSLGQASGYLHTLACEGGLPVRMIENESGYLINYFRKIYQALRGLQTNASAVKIAEDLSDTIPGTMQNELVYEVAGEFCQTLSKLLKEAGYQGGDPIASLRSKVPNWHHQLPLVLLEENAAEIVRRLLSQTSESRVTSGILIERIWIDVDDSWFCDARFRFPGILRTEQLKALFECEIQQEQSRLIVSAQWKNGGARLAMLSRHEQQDWRVELFPAATQKISGAEAMGEISLMLFDGPALIGKGIPKGGYELTEDLPWIFETMNESESQLKLFGMGSVSSVQESLFISLPVNSHLDISGDGDFDIPRVLTNSDRSLTKVSGVFSVILYDGAVCTVRTHQPFDSSAEYFIKPSEIDLVKSDYPVHRAWPKIAWKKELQHGIVPEHELYWRSIRTGNTTWSSVSTAMPKGQIEVRHVVNNEVLFSSRVVVLPADFDIKISPDSAQKGIITLSGIAEARVERYTNNENYLLKTDYLSQECIVYFDGKVSKNITVDLRVTWRDGCNLKLLLPSPVAGGRFVNHEGETFSEGIASVDHLHGVSADLLTISPAGKGFLNIELQDENPLSKDHHYLSMDIPLLTGRNENLQQISLYEKYNLLKSLLACSWSKSSSLRIYFYADKLGGLSSSLSVTRYDGRFVERYGRLDIDTQDVINFPQKRSSEVIVQAVSLIDPDSRTMILEKDVLGYDFSPLSESGVPWLIIGKLDNNIRIEPLILKWESASSLDDDLLIKSLCELDQSKRKSEINLLLSDVKNNPLQQSAYSVVEYLKKYKSSDDLPLHMHDLFNKLAKEPLALIQLLVTSCLSGDSEIIYDMQNELPFSWGWIPFEHWRKSFHDSYVSLAAQFGDEALALNILQPFVVFISNRAAIDRRFAAIANMLQQNFKLSQSVCARIPSVHHEQFNEAKQMLLRTPDSFGRVGTFTKEQWLTAISPDLKPIFKKFWNEDCYYTKFEKLFNLMLVAALLSHHDNNLMYKLSALFEIHYQQAPQQLGIIYQYYFEQAGVCH